MNPEEQYGYAQPKKRLNNRKKILIAGIVLVVGLILFSTLHRKSSPGNTVALNFLTYVQTGDYTNSYALFDSITTSTITQQTWKDQVTKLQKVFAGQKPQLEKTTAIKTANEGEESAYLYEYKLTGLDGKYSINILMTNNTDASKVINFNSKRVSTK